MLKDIQNELAKLIAHDIYEAVKSAPDTLSALKAANMTRYGGIPESVLEEVDRAFEDAIIYSLSDGFGKWRDGGSEARFPFRLTSQIIDLVRKHDWATAAKRTKDGNDQVNALGGDAKYNAQINSAVPQIVSRAIEACQGRYFEKGRCRILTPVQTTDVAHYDKTDFAPNEVFYVASGSEKETSKEYKRAKRLLLKRWFGFKHPPDPSAGPYFDMGSKR